MNPGVPGNTTPTEYRAAVDAMEARRQEAETGIPAPKPEIDWSQINRSFS